MELGADQLATGHYASVFDSGGRLMIQKGKDDTKDQSYFLFNLSQPQLEKIIFPLGNYAKSTVRRLARDFGLNVAQKKESQEICFVEGNDYRAFIKKEIGEEKFLPGPIVNAQGEKIGTHQGTPFYTIGQRKGLGISAPSPLYVTQIHPGRREIVVGGKEDLYQDEFEASHVNWYRAPQEGCSSVTAKVRIRYRSKESESEIFPVSRDMVRVKLKNPQPAITPGQAAVFYQRELVLGGGWIC